MTTTFYCMVEDDKPVPAEMFTKDIWPLLTEGADEAARLLARYLFSKFLTAKNLNGSKVTSLSFVKEWEALSRCNLEINMNS